MTVYRTQIVCRTYMDLEAEDRVAVFANKHLRDVLLLHPPPVHLMRVGLSSDVFQETSAGCIAVEPSSGINVIPRRALPGLAGIRLRSRGLGCSGVSYPPAIHLQRLA